MALTPMMQQYFEIKNQYEDCILFFRLGDFYEMFFEDAQTASRELEITLTGKDCGLDERAPMCGVPFHAANSYINKLITKGYKVAICEQVEDPKVAKGIVKRDVIRIITPGTQVDASALDENKNNYIAAISLCEGILGLSTCDVSTGEFNCTEIIDNNIDTLIDEIIKTNPSEIILSKTIENTYIIEKINKRLNSYINILDPWIFEIEYCTKVISNHFKVSSMEGLGLKDKLSGILACGSLLHYIQTTQKIDLSHINGVNVYYIQSYMVLDSSTRRNLELTETMREKSRKGSLLGVLDKTKTSMGGRLMRKWIEQPLIDVKQINNRLSSVAEIKDNSIIRSEIFDLLKQIYDIERLSSRIVFGSVNARELLSLKSSLSVLPHVKDLLTQCNSEMIYKMYEKLDLLTDIYELIENAIIDDPPISVKEGRIIKLGYNPDVDRLRSITTDSKTWIAQIESEEREKTGIKNLKVGYNKVFGYYIEVSKSNVSSIPDYYIRKQTISNGERYVIPKLKEIEETLLSAETKVMDLEYNIFTDIRLKITAQVHRIQKVANIIATLDVICNLAEVAQNNGYVMPNVNDSKEINIVDGRHPVVEKLLSNNLFVPNDTYLDHENNRLMIITGPNMAGKSTYMRQVALIVLMAQIGSFVPAAGADIGAVDKIFTRVGASDDLAAGQSTFMVEMIEVANILNNATKDSLIILDEIGRGTSTFDGLSIAWAVVEHIANDEIIGARTLFATHYHELTELEDKLVGINNYCIAVKEKGDDIIFLRKIIRGGADGSYGIQVAKLAGVPTEVTNNAKKILCKLEEADINKNAHKKVKILDNQINLFSSNNYSNEIIDQLKKIEVSTMTPIEALNMLYKISQMAKES